MGWKRSAGSDSAARCVALACQTRAVAQDVAQPGGGAEVEQQLGLGLAPLAIDSAPSDSLEQRRQDQIRQVDSRRL